MKNRILPVSALILLLTACSPREKEFLLPRVDNGGLVNANTYELYENVVTNQGTDVALVGTSTCSSCSTAKTMADNFAKNNHLEIKYLNIDNFVIAEDYSLPYTIDNYSENDYLWLYLVSVNVDNVYALVTPQEFKNGTRFTVPLLCLCKYGTIALETNTNISGYLNNYVGVID